MKASALLRSLPIVFAVFIFLGGARAEALGPDAQADASLLLVKPSAVGAELGAAVLFQPWEEHEAVWGPRLSVLTARGDGRTRFDLNAGIEGILWMVNAIGPGLVVQIVAPSTISGADSQASEGASVHFRFEPTLSVRLKHFGVDGAWAARVGIPFDSTYHWGVSAGVSLQFKGVPGIQIPE